MASRSIQDLTPEMQDRYHRFKEEMDRSEIPFSVTCTARNHREQVALYAQGRDPVDKVNALRALSTLPPITDVENTHKVTWTLDSKHIVRKPEDRARAFDIVILRDGKACWDIKVSVNGNDIPDYDEAGIIGENIGLKWGGRFKSPDRPHFEEC